MADSYDVTSFELDYCQADVAKIVKAIKAKASLLVIGMPGCGKSRLIDFLFHRPGVLEQYGLPANLKTARVDGDVIAADPATVYAELWRALGGEVEVLAGSQFNVIKDKLIVTVQRLEAEVALVVVFDNFSRSLQQTLGENFFNFLYALRNARSKLNLSYIFMANLTIDFSGFYKVDRLFDQGADDSVCWLSLLSQKDTFFSISRQWRKAGEPVDHLGEAEKQKIYEWSGGHALLNRYLSHLILNGEISPTTPIEQILAHGGIRAACAGIWADLEQHCKNLVIDLAIDRSTPVESKHLNILRNYGLLTAHNDFFSPLFASFVKAQKKASAVLRLSHDEAKTKVMILTIDGQIMSFALAGLSQRKRNLLAYLLANQGEPCTKDQLKDAGWPLEYKAGVPDDALRRQIEDIKKWLKEQSELSQFIDIETCWGFGYKLVSKG